ncbi:fibronectin type III domain-containing protein [Candidatus Parcubacteria bacterium]|nr:fibronectin type III domain-containing protein [Candidatus Parcubacteria bacterium]
MDRLHAKMMGYGWYSNWSQNPAAGLAHWAAFLLIVFITFSGLRGSINSTYYLANALSSRAPYASQSPRDKSGTYQIELAGAEEAGNPYFAHPQRFFPGDQILVAKVESWYDPNRLFGGASEREEHDREGVLRSVQSVALTNIDTGVKNKMMIDKTWKDDASIHIPYTLPSGDYELTFSVQGKEINIPLILDMPILPRGSLSYTGIRPGNLTASAAGATDVQAALTTSLPAIVSRSHVYANVFEPSVGINPFDDNAFYIDANVISYTTDGGRTFRNVDAGSATINKYYTVGSDPFISFTPDGKFSLLSIAGTPSGVSPYKTLGVVWTETSPKTNPLQLSEQAATPAGNFDFGKLAIDYRPNSPYKGSMYIFANVMYFPSTGSTNSGLLISRNGVTTQKTYSSLGLPTATPPSALTIGINGEIYYVLLDSTAQAQRLYKSTNGGASFTSSVIVQDRAHLAAYCAERYYTGSNVVQFHVPHPNIATGPDGTLYVVWTQTGSVSQDDSFEFQYVCNDQEVMLSKSTDGGNTWSVPTRVADDTTGADQSDASVAVDGSGEVYVTYIDHRNHPAEPLFDSYLAASSDGGQSWKNLRLSDNSFFTSGGGSARSPYGDYLNHIAAGNSKIYIDYPCPWVYNGQGFATDSCVAVIDKNQTSPLLSFTASASVVPSGSPVTLTWSSPAGSVCVASSAYANSGSGQFSGAKSASGSETFTPTTNNTYEMRCSLNDRFTDANVLVMLDTYGDFTPVVPTNIKVQPVSDTSATVSWHTDQQTLYDYVRLTTAGITGRTYITATVVASGDKNYTLTGLQPGVQYGASIETVSMSGRVYASNPIYFSVGTTTLPTSDTTPPSTPNLSGALSGSSAALSWTASTDNVGVTGYKVYRNGALLTSLTSTSYTDSSVSAGTTYSYAVSAYDAAGNASAQSNSITLTTPTPPPTSTFQIGNTVHTTIKVSVRSTSTTKGKPAGTQKAGATGVIVNGPQTGSGYTWWYVDFTSGVDGWVAQDYLAK